MKRTILIGFTSGHFRGAFYLPSEVGGPSEADTECKLGKRTSRVDSEPTLWHTLNAALASPVNTGRVKPMTCQTYTCDYLVWHFALIRYGKEWLAQYQDMVSQCIGGGGELAQLVRAWGM